MTTALREVKAERAARRIRPRHRPLRRFAARVRSAKSISDSGWRPARLGFVSIAAARVRSEKRAAAQALANYDCRFSKIEADLLVLKWMVGLILAGGASLVVKTFVV
jgi:hypothetical protein